jgi:tetratricopeptide (TPR) repeat protein
MLAAMSTKKRPPGTPVGEGKVVSIVGELGRRRAQQDRERASATHLRQLESSAVMAEHMASLEEMDLDAGIAELAGSSDPEARGDWVMLRALRACQSCMRGDTEAGLAEWDEVIAAEPGLATAYVVRAYWWMRTDPAAALADLDRAVVIDPKNAGAYARRGDCHRALGDPDRALANYRRAVSLDPGAFDVHYTMGAVLALRGELKEALACYDRAIALAPRYVEFYLARGTARETLGDLDRALQDYDRILELDPSREDVRSHRLQCLLRAGHGDRALEETAHRTVELADDPGPFTLLGTIHLAQGRIEEAIASCDRALALAPDHAPALGKRGEAWFQAGDYPRALRDHDRAIALAPGHAAHHIGRANALAKLDRFEEAIASVSRAIELEPSKALHRTLRAVYRVRVAEEDEDVALVRADLDRAVQLAPDEPLHRRKRVEFLIEIEELDAALADIEVLLARAPGTAELHYQRGVCESQLAEARSAKDETYEEPEEEKRARCASALADLEEAIALGLRTEDVYWELVRVQEQIGGEAELLAMVDRGLAALPDFVMLRALRHRWRVRRGDVEGAAADHARLLELGFKFRDE